MAKVRVLVGTRKGAFVITSDGARREWKVEGPHFGGWEVMHVQGSPVNPDRLYASTPLSGRTGTARWCSAPTTAAGAGSRSATSSPTRESPARTSGTTAHHTPGTSDVAISAAGAFRTDDGGSSWRVATRGLRSGFLPNPEASVGHCIHKPAMHPSRPDTVFMQKHWDVCRSDDAGESWTEVSGDLPSDFGFPIAVHAHEPETIYVVPILSDSEHYPPEGKLRVYRSRTGGNEWQALTDGLPQRDCYVNILRDAMAVDSLDSCGVYFGTTGGQVYASADAGDRWRPIVEHLPPVLSVEAQTLP